MSTRRFLPLAALVALLAVPSLIAGGLDTGSSVSVVDAANQSAMAVSRVSDYTFTYAADKQTGKPAKPLQIVVEVNPGDGSDRINNRKTAAELNDVFEAAAAARLASAKH